VVWRERSAVPTLVGGVRGPNNAD